MAETYKGLTIRIGGDTSGLQKSLRAVNSSIAQTEAQLRKMRTALRLDPGNTDAITKSLDLMGNKAIETQRRVLTLKRQIDQLGGERVQLLGGKQSTETVRQLADLTEDASARAAEARKQYNAITEELAQFYRPINDAVNATKNLDTQAGTALDEVRKLGAEYRRLTGKDFNAGNFISKSSDTDQAIAQLRELGLVTDEQAKKLVVLRDAYERAFNENQSAQMVLNLEKAKTNLVKVSAEANNATRQFSELSRAAMLSDLGKGIDDQLGHVESAARSVEAELKQLDDALRLDPHNVDLTAEKLRDLQESASIAQSRADLLDQKLSRLSSEGADKLASDMTDVRMEVERTAEAYDEATAEVKRMEAAVRDLESQQKSADTGTDEGQRSYQRLTGEIEEARNELRRLESAQEQAEAAFRDANMAQEFTEVRTEAKLARAEVNRYNDEVQQMGRFTGVTAGSLTSLGMSLSTSVTPTLIAAGWGIVESANDIDSAYRDMRKTVNGTERDFEALRDAAIDFSTTHVTSAEQILSIQAIGGELGVATEDLQTFAETVSNIEVATDLGAEDAATALGQLDNILTDLSGATMPNFSDALVRLGNNGASTESQIVDIASRIGSMGSIIGMSTPDILAWSSAIASTGQNTEAAGTAISNTMADIEQAVAAGGDALQGFADVANMSAEDFARTWESDPTTAMKAFIEGLNDVEANGGSASSTLAGLGITATRQTQAIMGLMQTVGGLDDALAMSNDAWNGVSDQWGEAGDAAREAQAKADGFSGSLSRLQNMAQNLGAELGESLVPVIDGAADILGELFEQFSEMPDSTKQAIVGVGAFVAALGPMILLGKGIGEFFGGVADGLTSIYTTAKAAGQIKSISGAFSVLKTNLSGVAGVLKGGLVVGGIAAAVGGISFLVNSITEGIERQEDFKRSTEDLQDVVSRTGDLDSYSESLESVGENAELSAKSIDELIESNARHVDSMEANTEAAEDQIAQLNTAQDIINRYAGQTDLTTEAQGRLEWALKLVNDQFGLSITQADVAADSYKDQDGNVKDLTDSINALIDAKKEEARVDALTSNLSEAMEGQREAAKTLADIEKQYDDLVNQYMSEGLSQEDAITKARNTTYEVTADGVKYYGAVLDAATQEEQHWSKAVSDTASDLGMVEAAASDSADEYARLSSTMDSSKFERFNSRLQAQGKTFEALTDDLRSLGVDTESFANLTDDQLKSIVSSYDGTAASIVGKLDELGISMSETGRSAALMAVEISDRIESMAGGTIATKLQNLGINLSDLSQKMADAGITSDQLRGDIVGDFDTILAMAGDDVNKLIFLIQNYNSTPIADKQGNINVSGEEILLYANGQIYTWNGQYLKDQNGTIVVQGLPDIEGANDDLYAWNNLGQLVNKETGITVTGTVEFQDVSGEWYTWSESTGTVEKNGVIYVDDLELTDAYDNVVKLEGEKLVTTGVDGTVRVNYDDVADAQSAVDRLNNTRLSGKTLYINQVYRTFGSKASTSGFTPQDRSVSMPQSQAATMSSKVASAVSATRTAASVASAMDGISLMSDESAKLARAVSAAPRAASAAASSLVGSMVSSLPGNRRSIRDATDLASEVVNNYYDVTVDGNGTTERVEGIVLELLDALEQLGKV